MGKILLSLTLGGVFLSIGCQSVPNQNEANPQDTATTTTAEAPSKASTAATVKERKGATKSAKASAPKKYTLPAETNISVRLIDAISTETNKAGDTFLASLAEPLTVNGVTLFGKDTSVQGKIVSLEEPGRVSGVA